MIWINFQKWSNSADRKRVWMRYYWRGYRWTPFIRGFKRYADVKTRSCLNIEPPSKDNP